ncbi:VirB6/TrbL-like conjugal transfer protein, CD1112 family [Blautia obeum]|uniref:VirB6/TrbL-like conjugal transfer protein, CD1112 family n=5 Tax=Clostridia TaxID=186801 RepID=UPI0011067DB1|nr:CD0415/CD1112 family protein [Blautia obeum]
MNTIIERITEAIKDILIGLIKSCLDNMFTSVNEQVGTIAGQVGQTPQGWNAGIFNLIQNISQTVIVPIAGLIITFVLCYELITMVTQKNNFHEFETYNIFLWIFKAYVAIYLVTNTFNITMAVFDVGQHVVNNAAGVISGNTAVDASEAITRIVDALEDMELGDLFLLSIQDHKGNVLALDKVNDSYTGTTFPGGHVEANEIFQKSMIREVWEETGLTVEAPKLGGLYHWHKSGVHYVITLYKADKFTGELKSSEEGRVYWIPLEELKTKELATGMEHVLRILESEKVDECYMHLEADGYVGDLY